MAVKRGHINIVKTLMH
jgi:hypothetical protein